jgi:hemoglobin
MTEPIMKIDHISEDGIRRLVDEFYARVRADTELAPIFNRAIPGDWGLHLATMRDFWSSVMLTSGRYKGNPVAVHLRIEGMVPRLFDRWLELFGETCGELFDDSLAEAFRARRFASPRVSSLPCFTGRTAGRGAYLDLRHHRQLHQVHIHGLRGSLPGRLLLRGREHARHSPR